jgi:phosphate transport system permease protein
MTLHLDDVLVEPPPPPPEDPIKPRRIDPGTARADKIFHSFVRIVSVAVLILTGAIGLFLGLKLIPVFRHYGIHFFTETQWDPEHNVVGIAAAVVGTILVALIALVVAFPLALLTALYISEYAPRWAKSTLISAIDLMAAVPSIIYGLWGFFFLMPKLSYIARWLSEWFGWIPIFAVHSDPHAARLEQHKYELSAFCAGVVVAMMVIPLACAIMRNVFDLAPLGEREAAYALGSTRWGMIRAVVLPFGRAGIIGGTMLGLGRALGETVAVLLIVSLDFSIKFRILENGAVTISALIADRFGEATSVQLSALLAAGFVLFLMTLVVNTLAAVVVRRSRSGYGVEI